MTDTTSTTSPAPTRAGRQIRFWGSAARLVVGAGMLIAAAVTGADRIDVIVGLAALPAAEIAVLAVRGLHAPPLRLYGNLGHCLNWGIGIAAFSLMPQAALLFYGTSIMIAFVRGYAGCEISAISNWLRRRDDQIVCPIFSPIDELEAGRAGQDPAC